MCPAQGLLRTVSVDAGLTLDCRLWESLAGRRVVPWGATRAPWHSCPSQLPAGPVSQVCPAKAELREGLPTLLNQPTSLPPSLPSAGIYVSQ